MVLKDPKELQAPSYKLQEKGFTLIEILIVVAIIGILASVVLVGLGPVQKQGRDARRLSDLRQIQTGLELWYNKKGTYPANMSTLDTNKADIGVSNIPHDPSTKEYYYYALTNSGAGYTLGTQLDDIANPALDNSTQGTVNTQSGASKTCDTSATNPKTGVYCVSI